MRRTNPRSCLIVMLCFTMADTIGAALTAFHFPLRKRIGETNRELARLIPFRRLNRQTGNQGFNALISNCKCFSHFIASL